MPSMLIWLALAGVLLTPGPTNTLLVVGGASRGFWRALIFSLAEISGYLISISVLNLALGPIIAANAELAWVVRGVACVYLCYLAWRLWTYETRVEQNLQVVEFRHVFVTTLLNPKGLIFALTMVPPGELPMFLAVFAATVLPIASFWIATGAVLGRKAGANAGAAPRWFHRGSAVVLGCFATLLVLLPLLR
ncbi:LysE family translocator [Roseiterribacter gracilis]|uniref:Threonine transporter RhtB n=1 Tax=Roseiterribacter gracilis TaxID=2812848 RepID=A0A8S8XA57_9PROT|nr:hypothetical protein TMPK1_04420 [Rhodospirillales bacterium TMPK1]